MQAVCKICEESFCSPMIQGREPIYACAKCRYFGKKEPQMKYEIGQKVSFEEALAHMKEGGCCKDESFIYAIGCGLLKFLSKETGNWTPVDLSYNQIKKVEFIICDDPEKKEEPKEQVSEIISPKDYTISNLIKVHWEPEVMFNFFDRRHDFAKALETFLKLKSHPLAKKAAENDRQFCIRFCQDGDIGTDSWDAAAFKLNLISPLFNTPEDARQAASDIGKEKLTHMFKTFQGGGE